MIDTGPKLSISKQARTLDISRGAAYYQPRRVSDADLKLMNRIEGLHVGHLFAGSRMLKGILAQEGFQVGRKHAD